VLRTPDENISKGFHKKAREGKKLAIEQEMRCTVNT